MDLLQAMRVSMTGLTTQRTKMNVISENLANSETTRTEEGEPYRRKMVVLQAESDAGFNTVFQRAKAAGEGVEVSEIVRSDANFRRVYNPEHPDADPQTGYVAMPDINTLTEMADMMVARRAYDANATAISNSKSMILKALEIGK